MPKYLGRTFAYDPRSGFRVPYEDMVSDGEEPGLIVGKEDADELNMQRFPARFFPEGVLPITFPPNETNPDSFRFGQIYDDRTFQLLIPLEVTIGGGAFELRDTFSNFIVKVEDGVYYQFLVKQEDGTYAPFIVREDDE